MPRLAAGPGEPAVHRGLGVGRTGPLPLARGGVRGLGLRLRLGLRVGLGLRVRMGLGLRVGLQVRLGLRRGLPWGPAGAGAAAPGPEPCCG
ncbi:hypothetical protein B1K54_20240 [Streptomyces sp. fd1-xmd]|nr:hypothetical protein B1K54_20240 [Streptomyces sp. fd1-xmd]